MEQQQQQQQQQQAQAPQQRQQQQPEIQTEPPRTTRITSTEVGILKMIFFALAMETRSRQVKKAVCTQVRNHARFCHLNIAQITRVLTTYVGEIAVRRDVGRLFSWTTHQLNSNSILTRLRGINMPVKELLRDFLVRGAITALCKIKLHSLMNEFDSIPTQFSRFLDRVTQYADASVHQLVLSKFGVSGSSSVSAGSAAGIAVASTPSSQLSTNDVLLVCGFAAFIQRVLMPYYERIWVTFSMEEGTQSIASLNGGRPDLTLSELERDITMERQKWYAEDHPMLQIFYASTYAGQCLPARGDAQRQAHSGTAASTATERTTVADTAHAASVFTAGPGSYLYTDPPPSNSTYPPPFALLAQMSVLGPLKVLIFSVFESAFYTFYVDNLTLQSAQLRAQHHQRQQQRQQQQQRQLQGQLQGQGQGQGQQHSALPANTPPPGHYNVENTGLSERDAQTVDTIVRENLWAINDDGEVESDELVEEGDEAAQQFAHGFQLAQQAQIARATTELDPHS